MGLPTTRRRGNSEKTDKPETSSKGGASKGDASKRDMPGTDDDDDDLIVSKAAPPPNGEYKARVNRCYFMKYKNGERVCNKKTGEKMPPQLEFLIDDPKEREKMLAHEPHNHLKDVKQGMDLEGNWRRRTNDLCAALGFPEDEWPKVVREVNGKKREHLKFPMKEIDALSEKGDDGKYKYFTITVETKSGEDANKGTPFTNITKIVPWVEKVKPEKKKKKPEPEPEPEDEDDDEGQDEGDSSTSDQPESTGDPDDNIPF